MGSVTNNNKNANVLVTSLHAMLHCLIAVCFYYRASPCDFCTEAKSAATIALIYFCHCVMFVVALAANLEQRNRR